MRILPCPQILAGLLLGAAAAAAPAADLCASGRRQSPIDIQRAARRGAPMAVHYGARPVRVVNDGHTVRLRIAPGGTLQLGRERYTLHQLHFHMPGGDRLQGEDFPLALHLLHRSGAGRLMSLVLLFRQGAENAALAALLPQLPAGGVAEHALAQPFDAAAFFPPAQQRYYAYEGSLTAPPCTEGVLWLVMQQPQTVSAAQLARLAQLFAPNARPVQPLNGRVVSEGG